MRRATQLVQHRIHHRAAYRALEAGYEGITRLVCGLEPTEFGRPSRCAGWTVADLTYHLLLDAQRALVALGSPSEAPPDLDYVSYWRTFAVHRDQAAADAHARHVRIASAAYAEPAALAGSWAQTSGAALRVAAAAPTAGRVTTQGHTLAVPDLLATLAVEAAVHHLDLVADLPGRPGPGPAATELAVRTLDGLLEPARSRPAWDENTWILKGSGRLRLTADERAALGDAAGRFPLLG